MRLRSLLLFAAALSLSAQEQPRFQSQVNVTAIDVLVDVRDKGGNIPAGLTAADFVVLEDGVERTVIGARYLQSTPASGQGGAPAATPAEPRTVWQLVLYFETELSSGDSRKAIAEELSRQADVLAAMGRVDVILANPTPVALVRDSRDADAIRQALKTVGATIGANQLAAHRRRFLDETQGLGNLANQRARVKTTNADAPKMDLGTKNTTRESTSFDDLIATPDRITYATIRPWIQQEVQLVSRFRANLVGWLAQYGRHTPRTLLLATDGFDVDPIDFYKTFVFERLSAESTSEIVKLSDSVAKTGQTLASAGWTTISIPGDNNAAFGGLDDASSSSPGRLTQQSRQVQSAKINQALRFPRQPLELIGEATGGSVVPGSGKIAAAVGSIDDRILLTYQVDRRPDGKPHKIEVRTRNTSLKVRSSQWAAAATPDEMAQTRAIKLLEVTPAPADFPLEATVEWNPPGATKNGTMRVVGKLDAIRSFLPASGRGDFRVTMAVQVPPNKAFAVNSVLPDYDFSDGSFRFRAPVNIPLNATGMSLVIEELGSGLSGVARVTVQ